MLLIPAIDIKERKCVRLREGRMDTATIFSDDPVAMAARWVEAGARRLHIVDLDGAFAGEPKNAGIIRDIVEAYPDLPIQVGGGIRDEETVEAYIQAGVRFVIWGPGRPPHRTSSPISASSFPDTSSSASTPGTGRSPWTGGRSCPITLPRISPGASNATAWKPSCSPTSAATG